MDSPIPPKRRRASESENDGLRVSQFRKLFHTVSQSRKRLRVKLERDENLRRFAGEIRGNDRTMPPGHRALYADSGFFFPDYLGSAYEAGVSSEPSRERLHKLAQELACTLI